MTRNGRLALIPAALVAVLGLVAVGPIGAGLGACAPPPPGWHRVTTIEDFAWIVPPLAVFLVGMYLALGFTHRSTRVLASTLVAICTVTIGFVFAASIPLCGRYGP